MKREVKLTTDNIFKYRKIGSRAWITITSGEHILSLDEGSRYEMTATTTITHLKLQGSISEVNISSSSLANLNDSFSDSSELETVSVVSSKPITDMEDTFNGSGIISFSIPTNAVVNFDRTFENTNRLDSVVLDTSLTETMVDTFKGSGVKNIDRILPFKGDFEGIISGAENVTIAGGLPLSSAPIKSSYIEPSELSGKMMSEMNILFARGKMIEIKDYVTIEDNVVDPAQRFEMSAALQEYDGRDEIENHVTIAEDNSIDSSQRFEMSTSLVEYEGRDEVKDYTTVEDRTIDTSQRFEMSASLQEYQTRDEITLHEFPSILDGSSSFEVDFNKLNVVNSSLREPLTQPSNIDTSHDASMLIETDYAVNNSHLNESVRSPNLVVAPSTLDLSFDASHKVEIDFSNTEITIHESVRNPLPAVAIANIDPTQMIEIDIKPAHIDIDPFDDGSCEFAMSDDALSDLVTGTLLPVPTSYCNRLSVEARIASPSHSSSIPKRTFVVGRSAFNPAAFDISGQTDDFRNSFTNTVSFSFISRVNLSSIVQVMGPTGGYYIKIQGSSYRLSTIYIGKLNLSWQNSGSYGWHGVDSLLPVSDFGTMAIVVNNDSIDLYINGDLIFTYTSTGIGNFTPEQVKMGGTVIDTYGSMFRTFNRKLTASEISRL